MRSLSSTNFVQIKNESCSVQQPIFLKISLENGDQQCTSLIRSVVWPIGIQISTEDKLVIKPHRAFNVLMLAVLTCISSQGKTFPLLTERCVALHFLFLSCAVAKQRFVLSTIRHL